MKPSVPTSLSAKRSERPSAPHAPELRRRGWVRVPSLWSLAAVFGGVAAIGAGAWIWLDSDAGRAFLAEQISEVASGPGQSVSIGAIGPGLPATVTIEDLKIGDRSGVYVSVERTDLCGRRWPCWPVGLMLKQLRSRADCWNVCRRRRKKRRLIHHPRNFLACFA